MEMITKATSDGIGYASKTDYEYEGKTYEADLKNGDKVTILNDGVIEQGQFGDQHYFKVKTRNGEKKAPFNQSSINILVPALGKNSEDWVGKEVNVLTKKTVIAGKKVIVAYFVTEGYYLDDFGDLTNDTRDDDVEPIFTPKSEGEKALDAIRNQDVEEPPF